MRTTVTLDEDVAAAVRAMMRERGISFKEAINTALRSGLGSIPEPQPYATPTKPMGARTGFDVEKALGVAAALEDAEIARKVELRK